MPSGTDDWTEPREARETRDLLGGDHDGPRDRPSGHLRLSKVGLDVFDRLLQLLDRPPLARAAHVRDLRQDVDAVARKVLGQIVHLPRQTPAGETEDREHQRDHRENGWDAADPTLKPGHRRSQHEREKDGECDRHEHGLRPVQNDNDEHTPGECHPRFQRLRRVSHQAQPFFDCAAQDRSARLTPGVKRALRRDSSKRSARWPRRSASVNPRRVQKGTDLPSSPAPRCCTRSGARLGSWQSDPTENAGGPQCSPGRRQHGHEHSAHHPRGAAGPRWRWILLQAARLRR